MRSKWLLLLSSLLVFTMILAACQSSEPPAVEESSAPPQAEEAAVEEPEPTEEPVEEPTEAPAAEPVSIALFHPVLGNSYTKAVSDGATAVAEEMGGTVDVFGADPAYDAVAQSNQIQDAITAGRYDAFIIYAVDGNAVVPDVEDAIEAGITVIAVDVVIGPDARTYEPYGDVVSYIGRTGIDHGTFLGEMIVMACEGVDPCKVGYLNGAQALTIDQDRVEALTAVIAEHPNIEIVANQEAFYLEDTGLEVTQNMLQANPDINVLATSGDQMMLGAEQAVMDAGLEGQVKLIGNGTGQQGYDAIKEGRFFADYADIPYTMGEIGAEFAINAVHGEQVPASVKLFEESPPLPEGGAIITQDNVDQFDPQW